MRAFCAVADSGTMTAAAHQLGYTVGAVSQQISALQNALPQPILVKDGRKVALTDAGITLLGHARALIELEKRAEIALSGRLDDQETVVRLGVFGSAALHAVKPTVQYLNETDPQISLQVIEVDVERMSQAVLEDEVEIAIGIDYSDAPQPPHRGLASTFMHSESFHLVLPPAVRSFASSPALLHDFLNDADWILPPARSWFGKAALFACARNGIQPKERHSVIDTALSISLAESGIGVTLATPFMMALGGPTTVLLADLPVPAFRKIVALTRTDAEQRLSIQKVQAALKHTFRVLE